MLSHGNGFKAIGEYLAKDPTTIAKEVKSRRIREAPSGFNATDRARKLLCPGTPSRGRKRSFCKKCPAICPLYEPKTCPALTKPPYVCNGRARKASCRLAKWYYRANAARSAYEEIRVISRVGIGIDAEDLRGVDAIVRSGLEKGQPLVHIYLANRDAIPVSLRTLYNYIDAGVLTAKNIDLRRKVSYKPRKKKKDGPARQKALLLGRGYEDFLRHTAMNPSLNVWEMDTVVGRQGGKVLLTPLPRDARFMMIFLLDSHTQAAVLSVFDAMEAALGTTLFQTIFAIILTDNGPELINPPLIENGDNGERRASVFYCHPYQSQQKGAIEKNHEYIRYFFPKGASFDDLSLADGHLMANHINNTARPGLGGLSPLELASPRLDGRLLAFCAASPVAPANVVLNTSLFAKQ
jgi:IS30 family transposase